MTGGYILLKDDFAGLIMENLLGASPFNYDGAYDYLLSVVLSGKPIIFSAKISIQVVEQTGTVYTHDILSSLITNDKVSITVWYQGSAYEVSVLKSAKNNVTITAIGG